MEVLRNYVNNVYIDQLLNLNDHNFLVKLSLIVYII